MTPHTWENLPKEKGHGGQTSFQSQRTDPQGRLPSIGWYKSWFPKARGTEKGRSPSRIPTQGHNMPNHSAPYTWVSTRPFFQLLSGSEPLLNKGLGEATVLWRSSLSVCYPFYGKVPCAVIQSSPHCRSADECGASGEHRCSSCHNANHRGVWDLLGLQCLNSRVPKFPGFLCKDLKLSPHPTASGSENLGWSSYSREAFVAGIWLETFWW